MKDLYHILGVDENSDLAEINDAYRILSKKFHPSRSPGDPYCEKHFREINEAYGILADPAKRSEYDAASRRSKILDRNGEELRMRDPSSTGPGYRPGGPHYKKIRRKGPGVAMTIVLILIALILGDYLIRYISNSKKAPIAATTTKVADAPEKSHKAHKRKRGIKPKTALPTKRDRGNNDLVKQQPTAKDRPVQAAAVSHSVQPVAVINNTQPAPIDKSVRNTPLIPASRPAVVRRPVSSAPAAEKTPNYSANYLYEAYVKPNVTGIINLRKYGNYSSEVIATIPAKSKVYVLEKGDTYYKVAYDNTTGYIPRWTLQSQ